MFSSCAHDSPPVERGMAFKEAFKQQLLSERERVLAELASIENLLVTRCDWSPPNSSTPKKQASVPAATVEVPAFEAGRDLKGHNEDDSSGIAYTVEADAFLASWLTSSRSARCFSTD